MRGEAYSSTLRLQQDGTTCLSARQPWESYAMFLKVESLSVVLTLTNQARLPYYIT